MRSKRHLTLLALLFLAGCARPLASLPPPPPPPPPMPPPPPPEVMVGLIDYYRNAEWHHVYGGPVTDGQYHADRERCGNEAMNKGPRAETDYWWFYFECLRKMGYEPDRGRE